MNSNQKNGSLEQGSGGTKSLTYEEILSSITRDLQTARVMSLIPSVDDSVLQIIRSHFLKRVKEDESVPSFEQIRSDCSLAGALLAVVLSNETLMQLIADYVKGAIDNADICNLRFDSSSN